MRRRPGRAVRRAHRRTPLGVLVRRFAAVAALLCAALLAVRAPSATPTVAASTSAPAAGVSDGPADEVRVPVRLTDPAVAAWLVRGDVVDLYAGDAGLPLELAASGLRVVGVFAGADAAVTTPGPVVILAVPDAAAARVVGVATAAVVVVTLSAPFTPR